MSGQDDVQEFAAVLRALKDRTDRSYGQLARRLNMNTSTLHRYCAGDAVPLDFAPAERFAALCGASAQERLELHRRWLLAVEARQRPRTPPAPPAEPTDGTEPTDTAEPTDGADPRTGPTETAAPGTGPAEPAAPLTEPTEPANPPAHATDTAPLPGVPGVPGAKEEGDSPATEVVTPPGDDEVVAATVLAAAPPPRSWFHRRPVTVAAAVATVLLATVAGLSALPSDRPSGDGHARAVEGGTFRPTATGSPPAPSGSPTSPSPGTPSPSSTARGNDKGRSTPGEPKATSPGNGASAGSGGRVPVGGTGTGTPLTWTADSQVWDGGCGHDYVIDKEPAQVPPPPVSQDAGVWAATQGAVHGRQTMVRISVQGKSSTAVVLEALRVRIVSRGTPATGNAYAMDQGCGGGLTPRYFDVNLDIDRPIARSVRGNDSGTIIPPVRFPYRVSAQDPEVLLVTATTQTYDANWYLELDWSSQGRTGTIRVDDQGRPFRTSATKGLPYYWYGTNGHGVRQWVPADFPR